MASEIRKNTRKKTAASSRRRKKRPPKHLDLRKFFSVTASVITLLGITGFLLWYFSFDTLDLKDFTEVSYSGYNTKGTAELSILEKEEYEDFLEDVEIELLSENGSLENGDFLEISFLYNKEAAKAHSLRIESDTCQIEVAGLPEGTPLSQELLFQDLEVSYEGIAPALSVQLENNSDDPFLQTVQYEIMDARPFYDNGDTFSIKAAFSEEAAILHEYALPSSEDDCILKVSVEDRDRYIRDASELSSEQLHTLNTTAASLFGEASEYGLRIFSEANLMPIWVNGKTTFVWSNPRLLSAYLNILKPEYFENEQAHNNDIKLVYLATLSQADGVACDAEVVVQFNDLLRKADGSYDLSLASGEIIAASFKDAHIKDLVNDAYNKEYESEKLPLS